MSVKQMRAAIYEVYSGRQWKIKVQNMSDAQVIAVYHSFLEKGKFDKHYGYRKTDEVTKAAEVFKPYVGEQLKFDI